MKYKVGDKVRIKSIDWYNRHAKETEDNWKYFPFSCDMKKYCGQIMTISIVRGCSYSMIEDDYRYAWTDEMIEGLVEEETLIERVDDNGLPFNEWLSHKGAFYIPDGYVLKDDNDNVINATKIVLEKKKKEYPKTFLECCDVLNIGNLIERGVKGYKAELFDTLQKLLICRDAYWKIAGEEMGLEKPWEPNYTEKTVKYCLRTNYGRIVQTRTSHDNHPFSFPTEEMAYAFYENFKSEIENCKELL